LAKDVERLAHVFAPLSCSANSLDGRKRPWRRVSPIGYGRERPLQPLRARLAPLRAGSTRSRDNRGFEQWGEILGDAMVAAALTDRLVHHATMITLKGKGYRLRERGQGVVPAALSYKQERWCTFRRPNWCTFRRPLTRKRRRVPRASFAPPRCSPEAVMIKRTPSVSGCGAQLRVGADERVCLLLVNA
jgi:IstB-like ATP binding protein